MSPLKISDIVGIINKKYPFVLAEEWDNVGLQVGDPTAELSRIMVALDPLPTVIDEAITLNCQLLVTHHPLIFSPLRQITASTSTGSSIIKAVRGGLALLAMHTNYDIAHGGLNDLLATRIGLHTTRPLKITARDELVKLVVFVPAEQLDMVRLALLPHTAAIGNYRNCSFSAAGEGTFLPLEGARPAIGSIGTMGTVMEQRLELLIRRDQLAKAVKTMLTVHPYEEPAFDCYPLLNESSSVGLGRIGRLAEQANLGELATTIAQQLGCSDIRLVGDPARKISTVAVCSGSGASLLHDAVRAGADLLLTGDVKYHEAREAELQGIAVLDAGHFSTEQLMVDAIRAYLETSLATSGCQLEIVSSRREQNPFTNVVIR